MQTIFLLSEKVYNVLWPGLESAENVFPKDICYILSIIDLCLPWSKVCMQIQFTYIILLEWMLPKVETKRSQRIYWYVVLNDRKCWKLLRE